MAATSSTPRQTALITGASSGIGEALARRFARAGFNLVLVARSADKLAALASSLAKDHGIKAWVAPADLARPDAARQLAASMKRSRRPIDVLVNNAGVLEHGRFVDMPSTRHRELIDLNVTGLSEMLAQFVPAMVARGQGRVLNVASIAAFQPVPDAGHLRGHQGLRAVADRIAVRRTAGHRRDHHHAVPGHHRDLDARPRQGRQRRAGWPAGLRRRQRRRGGRWPASRPA
jgi:NADP-dependent 3-hydroxy acid dehydrogenase YdfG